MTAPTVTGGDSNTRQSDQICMRREVMQRVASAAGWEWSVVARRGLSCAVRGSPCDVRASAGAADRRRAQQRGLERVGMARVAAERVGRWVVVCVLDDLGFQEREECCRVLSHGCDADWLDRMCGMQA